MLKPRVFIIIPVHNRREVTLACLANLQQTGDLANFQVVVVDDGSTDGTAEAVRSSYPEVKCLAMAICGGQGRSLWGCNML